MKIYTLIFVVVAVLLSCQIGPVDNNNNGPADNSNGREKVILLAQGGPSYESFSQKVVDGVFQCVDPAILKINVDQVQTLKANENKFKTQTFTFEQITKEVQKTTDLLADEVKKQKDAGKKVYVVGLSYGAWVVQSLLSKYGKTADGYIVSVGRLDMEKKGWETGSKGTWFSINLDNTVKVKQDQTSSDDPKSNIPKIAAALMQYRYTELLKNIDFSNIVYVYGKNDETSGPMTTAEINFLKNKKATLIAGDGDHMTTMFGELNNALKGLGFQIKANCNPQTGPS